MIGAFRTETRLRPSRGEPSALDLATRVSTPRLHPKRPDGGEIHQSQRGKDTEGAYERRRHPRCVDSSADLVLFAFLVVMNGFAAFLRARLQRRW